MCMFKIIAGNCWLYSPLKKRNKEINFTWIINILTAIPCLAKKINACFVCTKVMQCLSALASKLKTLKQICRGTEKEVLSSKKLKQFGASLQGTAKQTVKD